MTATGAAKMTIHVDQPGHAIPSTFYGAFFEEINNGGEGGTYAELVDNRAFNAQTSETSAPSRPTPGHWSWALARSAR